MFIAIDQCNNHYPIHAHPRKELLELFDRQHASKMYRDRKDGVYHVGYVIAGHWLEVFGIEGLTFATKES